MQMVIPKIISDLLSNPGIGFIAAPHLMGDPAELRDNRGTPVEKYRFPQSTKTWNHPDSGLYYCGGRWKELEPEPGEYRWDILDNGLEKARQMGCTSIVRIAPYALRPEEDVPLWMRERWPEEPDYPFWRVDPNTTDYAERWSEFIRAFAARFDGDERISSVDLAITGAWGEGGGSEFVVPEKLEQVVSAYLDGFTKTPIQALLHDPVSVACIRRHRAKVGFRVDCLGDMGGFHPGQWSHMEDYYPQNVVNFHMQDAWKEAPVVFEACWHTNDWYLQGWDIDYIIDESLKWHQMFPVETDEAYIEATKTWDDDAIRSPIFGFVYSDENLKEIELNLVEVEKQFEAIRSGFVDFDTEYPKAVEALKNAGIDEYIADLQRQVDEFLAA